METRQNRHAGGVLSSTDTLAGGSFTPVDPLLPTGVRCSTESSLGRAG